MKVGMCYLYNILAYGYPPRMQDGFRAFSYASRMGFHYVEIEALGPLSRHSGIPCAPEDIGLHLRRRIEKLANDTWGTNISWFHCRKGRLAS
jgi:hypothetical protein